MAHSSDDAIVNFIGFVAAVAVALYFFFQSQIRVAEAVCQGELSAEGALVKSEDSWAWIKLERTRGAIWMGALPFIGKDKQIKTVQIRIDYPDIPVELPAKLKPDTSGYMGAYSAGPTWFGVVDFEDKEKPYNLSFALSSGQHLEVDIYSGGLGDEKGQEIVAHHSHRCSLLEGFD